MSTSSDSTSIHYTGTISVPTNMASHPMVFPVAIPLFFPSSPSSIPQLPPLPLPPSPLRDPDLAFTSPVPNMFGLSFNGVQLSPFSLANQQYVIHGVTPLTSQTPTSSSSNGHLPPAVSLPKVQVSANLLKKTKNLPQYLTDAFHKKIIHSTRLKPLPDGEERMQVMKPLMPNEMTQEQRKLIKEASKITQKGILKDFLGINRANMYSITHRNEKNGRPSLISDEGFSRIHQAVEEAELDKKSLTKNEAIALLKEEAIRTSKERNAPLPDLTSILHNSTRLLEKAEIIVRTG